jgi:CheY-like chemotaxis protein
MTTVLVVDDEPVLRAVVCDVLVEAGYTVVEAADGHAMLALVERDRPDLVLMDVMMPGSDGREAYQALRGRPELRSVPVVMMSAAVYPKELDPTIAAFLPKPFALELLLATVARLIGQPTTADQR